LVLSLIYEFVKICEIDAFLKNAPEERLAWRGTGARERNASQAAFGATTCTKDSFREMEVQSQY
jgi:hypothetical protein